jgi:hypothetical protein
MRFRREKQNEACKKNHVAILSYKQKTMKHIIAVILTLCVVFSGVWHAAAESSSVREYQVKAAFLFNFAKFVEWPDSAFSNENSPIIISVLGYDPFGESLDALKDRVVGGRRFLIKRISSVEELGECHILFISSSERGNLSQILQMVKNKNILTVGDTKGFTQSGVIINIIPEESRLGFEINLDAAEHTHLKIGSQLLKLARLVSQKVNNFSIETT